MKFSSYEVKCIICTSREDEETYSSRLTLHISGGYFLFSYFSFSSMLWLLFKPLVQIKHFHTGFFNAQGSCSGTRRISRVSTHNNSHFSLLPQNIKCLFGRCINELSLWILYWGVSERIRTCVPPDSLVISSTSGALFSTPASSMKTSTHTNTQTNTQTHTHTHTHTQSQAYVNTKPVGFGGVVTLLLRRSRKLECHHYSTSVSTSSRTTYFHPPTRWGSWRRHKNLCVYYERNDHQEAILKRNSPKKKKCTRTLSDVASFCLTPAFLRIRFVSQGVVCFQCWTFAVVFCYVLVVPPYLFLCIYRTQGRRRLQGFLPQLDEFYFTTAEKKIWENCRCIVPNFMND